LENAIKQARKIAEVGARKALEALAVHEPDPYKHMDKEQRRHRKQLQAQAKQLGDTESQTNPGAYEIKHLVEKTAYDQWHRLLFARFLLENNLLISPDHGVSVTLDDCEELAPSLKLKDAWAVAARFAAVELPQIFRADDPAGAVELPVEDRNKLVQLVKELPVEVFTASDSLGWCYQFWQAERKDEVNKAGTKIGADELPAVTQLFTEDYMVDFLLDNTLGAWHAGKRMKDEGGIMKYETEEEARAAVSLPGCPWKYLRFIKAQPTGEAAAPPSSFIIHPSSLENWQPAAGSFPGWPHAAAALRLLDPCMGSGHFVVAMFERLVALRMAEEKLDEQAAVAAVIRDNLFGLELDPRCTQIGAFNLALAAWRRVGHCALPAMNLACSGLAPNTKLEDWLKLAGDNEKLRNGMERLFNLFEKAPVLGSLINPRHGADDMFVADYHEVSSLLQQALQSESTSSFILHPSSLESAVTARGLAKAAEILAGQFTLVATNVPYLGRGKQDEVLQDYCERVHSEAKSDLATCFVERCLSFCASCGSTALVTPQNWLFLASYRKFRERLLASASWSIVARLGEGAFDSPQAAGAFTATLVLTRKRPTNDSYFSGQSVADEKGPDGKAAALLSGSLTILSQLEQAENPDSVITVESLKRGSLLQEYATAYEGAKTVDIERFRHLFWELPSVSTNDWWFHNSSPTGGVAFSGCHYVSANRSPGSQFQLNIQTYEKNGQKVVAWLCGKPCWERRGVAVAWMRDLPASLYLGTVFDNSAAVIMPLKDEYLPAVYCFVTSGEYSREARKINQKVQVAAGTLDKVPFDLPLWQKVAAEKYPHGLPQPFSSDPTQWLFNGHPAGADQPLQVAVARLLGYQWPRQTGSSFPDCPALAPDGLEKLADDDGIVPISPAKGEGPAAERLRELLARAFGKDWSATKQEELLAQVDYAGATLEDWLRNGFFEQHCALFHNRPFLWHLWDGHKNGFSALVNYHKLTHANLEKLTYAYLGDWIRRQQSAVDAGDAGSDARLQAAKQLQTALKLILEGEPPYDLFVRWKGLAAQAIGWNPDLNDGVRMNIRPFATADILRKRVKIKWEKDRGKEPQRDKGDFPWFWSGSTFTGDRVNDVHLTKEQKEKARK